MNTHQQFNLEGKVAIITGSSKGIGKAIAKGLAEKGAQVVISSRNQDACDEVVKEFSKLGLKAIGIACHIGKEDQRKALVDQTIKELGRIDILVNNAAINPIFGPIEDVDPAIFDKIMDVNVKAPWALSNLVLPHISLPADPIRQFFATNFLSPHPPTQNGLLNLNPWHLSSPNQLG